MALDPSIYQAAQPIQTQMPSLANSAGTAMNLSDMALKNQGMQMNNNAMQLQLQQQQAARDAYANNMGSDGKLDQKGFLSDLGKSSPQAAMDYSEKFNKMNKDAADAQGAQLDAANKVVGQTLPKMQYLAGLSEDDRAKAFPEVMGQLEASGVPMNNVPKDSSGNYIYDPGWFKQSHSILQNTSDNLANMQKRADIQKTYADIGKAPAELNAALYGSRSPNAELSSQYQKEAAPIKASQMYAGQMLDAYKNQSPQGDAALVLNAYKIKFPNAPDVNSLEELTKSQSASDTFKNAANKVLEGGLDQNTRDNLMRDGISTFRANRDTLQGIQQRYNDRAKFQNVNDPTLTSEPAVDKTYGDMMALQKNIGPYVPPSQRPGIMASVTGGIKSLVNIGGDQKASADQSAQKFRRVGSNVSADEVDQYAMKHGLTRSGAQDALKGFGYAIGR